jgi:hypothetical protein
MPISLENTSNIRVTYNTGSNYIIETVKSDMYVRGTTSGDLSSEPTVSPTLTSNIGVFTHSGGTENQTPHTIYFPVNTTCDILIVGGGGGGGGSIGGGGGGGSVIYSTNITIPSGSYSILVGKGGNGGVNQTDGSNGFNTVAFGATAVGGGRGGDYDVSNSESSGGSGGGEGGGANNNQGGVGVAGLKGSNTIPNTSPLFTNYQYYVNDGGLAFYQNAANLNATRGGGGGGAGTAGGAGGGNAIDTTTQGLGGDGIPISISGNAVYYGAGGGGGGHKGSNSQVLGKSGGLGGGGNGGNEFSNGTKTNGTDGTGFGAGGGGGAYLMNGGDGGSGIVIIKVISPTTNKYLFFNYLPAQPTLNYTLNFPTRTIANFNNSGDEVMNGQYTVSVRTTQSTITPTQGQNLQDRLYFTSNLAIRYHTLNPVKTAEGAQWTYSSNNPNVYHLGSVGIGTTSPEYSLDVRGFIYSSSGGYTSSALTKWSVLSDRRIKENIVKASYDKCLENVKNIELYNFNFKDNYVNTNDRRQLGFIAQEVQQIYPKAVEVSRMIMNLEEKIDDLLTLNTTQIDYTLYGSVKCLIQKLENIKIKMEQIKTVYNITT